MIVHLLPVSGVGCGGDFSRTQVEWLVGYWGTDADEMSLFPKEHGNKTGLAHPSWSVNEKFVVFVRNEAIEKSSFETSLHNGKEGWCCMK